jgi:hypothetical protein
MAVTDEARVLDVRQGDGTYVISLEVELDDDATTVVVLPGRAGPVAGPDPGPHPVDLSRGDAHLLPQ